MADSSDALGQEDIERLLAQARGGQAPGAGGEAPSAPAAGTKAPPASAGGSPPAAMGDIEFLLDKASAALESVGAGGQLPAGISPFEFQEFGGQPASTESATLDLIRDVELDLTIELGRTHLYLEDVLKLRKGSVVPLDKLAGDPVDVYVNGRLVARGEVLVLNDNFCVRIAELVAPETTSNAAG